MIYIGGRSYCLRCIRVVPADQAEQHERGLGLIVAGMTHQGWDVQLTAYAARDWRPTFFPVGIAHSIVAGSAWEPTPWRAVQRAAWATLTSSR